MFDFCVFYKKTARNTVIVIFLVYNREMQHS